MGYTYNSGLSLAQQQAQQRLMQQQAQQRQLEQQQIWSQQQRPPVVKQQPESFWDSLWRKLSEFSDKLDGPPATNRNYPPQMQRPMAPPRQMPPRPEDFPLPRFAYVNVTGTGYYPHNSRLEGGFHDKQEHDLCTLQDYLQGKVPYVSVALDPKIVLNSNILPLGTYLRIPELEQAYNKGMPILFKVVDIGGHFKHRAATAIDICTANKKASEGPVNRKDLSLHPISQQDAERIDRWRAQYQGK